VPAWPANEVRVFGQYDGIPQRLAAQAADGTLPVMAVGAKVMPKRN